MNRTLEQAIDAARLRGITEWSYYGTALCSLNFYERLDIPTLCVDQHLRCYVNPEYFLGLKFEHQVGVLTHETLHPVLNHPARREAINAEHHKFNIAGDLEINCGPKLRSWLPSSVLFPAQYNLPDGKSAEWYYANLPDNDDGGEVPSEDPGEGEPRGPGGQGHTSDPDDGPHKPGGGNCGSCAHGGVEDHESPAPDKGGDPGLDKGMVDIVRRQVAEQVEQASKTRGDEIGGAVVDWARTELTPPKIPWQRKLGGVVKDCINYARGLTEPTYQRPSRLWHPGNPVLLPSKRDPAPQVTIVVDTSGSMSRKDLTAAMSEVQGILRVMNGRPARIMACDSRVYKETLREVSSVRDIKLAGGGGTNMAVGIEVACAQKPRPDVLIVATDLETPWPKVPPKGTRVIVLGIGSEYGLSYSRKHVPNWCRYVEVER